MTSFQTRVRIWCNECFGSEAAIEQTERRQRFYEEATELMQACGQTREECIQLVDYVYGRPVGELSDELGGTMVGLAALATAYNLDMSSCANAGLAKNWRNIEKIRAKHKAKPRFGPLPGPTPTEPGRAQHQVNSFSEGIHPTMRDYKKRVVDLKGAEQFYDVTIVGDYEMSDTEYMRNWKDDQRRNGWLMPTAPKWKRLPIIRHWRAFRACLKVDRHEAFYRSLGQIPDGYDRWVIFGILCGKERDVDEEEI